MTRTNTDPGTVDPTQLDRFYLILGGHIFFQTLAAGTELGLFNALSKSGPATRAQLAQQLEIAEKPLRILLSGCTALGLTVKKGHAYQNSPAAEKYLVEDAPQSMVPIIRWQHYINYKPMWHFKEAIEANDNIGLEKCFKGDEPTLYERLTHHTDDDGHNLEQIFQDAMHAISVQANAMLAENVDFSDIRHVVDVGGGDGSNIITLARKNPHLRATVFDSPSVCDIARANIAKAGLFDRLDAVPGDCWEDSFPEDADCLLFCHFLTIWSEEENQRLLQKAMDAVPSGDGRVMVFNMMQNDAEDGPLSTAIGSPYFLTIATGKGMLYTWSEYNQWMRRAGAREVQTQELPMDHGVVVGLKA